MEREGFGGTGILIVRYYKLFLSKAVVALCCNRAHPFHQFGDAVRIVVEDGEKLVDSIGILHHELGVVEIAQLEDRL